jgi:ABC-type lipoprotein export system ATPase subunit
LLSVKNLKKTFSQGNTEIEILKNVSVNFEKNKTYAITGESGIGKSTFMHIISGIEPPTSGKILYNNKKLSPEILKREIGLVFQFPYLIKELSVLENIILKDLINKENFNMAKQKGLDLLKKFNLQHKAFTKPSTLSGGEQQRISILRAIFNKPSFLIADEPTGNLDEITAKNIVDLLIKFQKEWGMGLIIISHDKYICKRMEKVFILKNGLLQEEN